VNPEDNRRLSVYPQVEVEFTADVCPSGAARDAVDQGRDGRIIWAGSRSEPPRQGRGRGRSFDSGHGNGPPAHLTEGPPANPSSSTRVDRATHVPRPAADIGSAWSAPNTITAVLVGLAGLTFILKAGGGLYWLIPAAVASLLGGVVNAWLFLVRLPS
jgi:hypothetical protein